MDMKVIWDMSAKVILFDLGGVLIDFVGLQEVGKLLRHDPGPSEIRSRWIASDAIIRFERGDVHLQCREDRQRRRDVQHGHQQADGNELYPMG